MEDCIHCQNHCCVRSEVLVPHLDDEGLGGGAAADDGLGRVAPLWSALVVQHGAGHGGGAGELDDPVAVQVVLPPQVLDG